MSVDYGSAKVVADAALIVPKPLIERVAELGNFSVAAGEKVPMGRIVMFVFCVLQQLGRRVVFGIKTDTEQHPVLRPAFLREHLLLCLGEVVVHARTEVGKGTLREKEGDGDSFAFEIGQADRLAEFVG